MTLANKLQATLIIILLVALAVVTIALFASLVTSPFNFIFLPLAVLVIGSAAMNC